MLTLQLGGVRCGFRRRDQSSGGVSQSIADRQMTRYSVHASPLTTNATAPVLIAALSASCARVKIECNHASLLGRKDLKA
jgi:hypothetical protein